MFFRVTKVVIAGLDPAIHCAADGLLDRRLKAGDDS
jgi:hypothetical protein